MKRILIENVNVVNEDLVFNSNVLLSDGKIESIGKIESDELGTEKINGSGLFLLPGLIDDQVHFREPGLTHKEDIYSGSKAAVAGGITSFMEMPNTLPPAVSLSELEKKYDIASHSSLANYSFFLGASSHNIDELVKADFKKICGVKIFMGSSTGSLAVNDPEALEKIFSLVKGLIATHCEDDHRIAKNLKRLTDEYGENLPAYFHPLIRDEEACYLSSSLAIRLAKKYNTRLHILHISTAKELTLFRNDIPLSQKQITCEACIHHLWFCDEDYPRLGNLIKWNPAVKSAYDREKILEALVDGRIDVVATDHAPHTIEEKGQEFLKAPSGGPLVQHALPALLELYHQKKLSLTDIARKGSHNPAELFRITNRGFIRENYQADLVLVNLNKPWTVSKDNLLYKCGWSPFEGQTFCSSVVATFVNGVPVFRNGEWNETSKGQRLEFDYVPH